MSRSLREQIGKSLFFGLMRRGTTTYHFKIFALWHKLARRSAAGGRRPSCQVVSEWIFWNDVWWFPSASMRNIYILLFDDAPAWERACLLAGCSRWRAGWLAAWLACLPFIADCMLIVAESQNVRNVFDWFRIFNINLVSTYRNSKNKCAECRNV